MNDAQNWEDFYVQKRYNTVSYMFITGELNFVKGVCEFPKVLKTVKRI